MFLREKYPPIAIAAVALLLQGVVCIPPEPPVPDRLKAPVFKEGKVVVERLNGTYEELIYLRWAPPDTDSVPISVKNYVIIQHLPFDTAADTLGVLSSEPEILPATRTFAYQRTENLRRYGSGEILSMYYQIYAVDSLERPGDTSEPFGVALLRNVTLLAPTDTLSGNNFVWETRFIQDEIFTNMMLWREADASLIFISDTVDYFTTYYDIKQFSARIPNIRWPLQSGIYTWAVRLEKPQPPPGATSFTLGTFRVP